MGLAQYRAPYERPPFTPPGGPPTYGQTSWGGCTSGTPTQRSAYMASRPDYGIPLGGMEILMNTILSNWILMNLGALKEGVNIWSFRIYLSLESFNALIGRMNIFRQYANADSVLRALRVLGGEGSGDGKKDRGVVGGRLNELDKNAFKRTRGERSHGRKNKERERERERERDRDRDRDRQYGHQDANLILYDEEEEQRRQAKRKLKWKWRERQWQHREETVVTNREREAERDLDIRESKFEIGREEYYKDSSEHVNWLPQAEDEEFDDEEGIESKRKRRILVPLEYSDNEDD
ncbi:unnamed protein product [Rhizophagus irregularis]|nr:unnamed protein product [Rhizophagus irregularis]